MVPGGVEFGAGTDGNLATLNGTFGLFHSCRNRHCPQCLRSLQNASLAEQVAQAAKEAAPAWNLLFVHADADADGDAGRALRERIVPGLDLVRGLGLVRTEGVAVLPVRMKESWVLADSDALRAVFGTTLDDAALGLTLHGAALERLADPKLTLDTAFAATRPTGQRARAGATALLNALGACRALGRACAGASFGASLGVGEAWDCPPQRAGNDGWNRKSPRPFGLKLAMG